MLTIPVAVLGGLAQAHGDSSPPSANPDVAVWSELDVTASLSQRTELTWAVLGRWMPDGGRATTYATGLDLNVKLFSHLTLTPSYYHSNSRTPSGQWVRSHLPVLAATLSAAAGACVISDRNRVVGVLGKGSDFWVYQNRPRADCRMHPVLAGASLFVWDELSYYSIFDGWTRNRLAAGVRVPFGQRSALDLYYLRQHDVRTHPANLNVIGLSFELRGGLERAPGQM